MSEVKQRCQIESCNRAAFAHCFCCNKNVCTRHFTEHVNAIKAQIDPLANEINTMVEKIQGLTIEQITEASFTELKQWKINMHQLVDEIFSAKTKEIEEFIEKNQNKFDEHKKQQSENILKIQDDIKQLVEDGDATFEQIQLLKNQLTNVETNLTSFQKDFLLVEVKMINHDLVTLSSNLNKPPTSTIFAFNFGNSSFNSINEISTFPTNNSLFGTSSSTPLNFGGQALQTDNTFSNNFVRSTYIRRKK